MDDAMGVAEEDEEEEDDDSVEALGEGATLDESAEEEVLEGATRPGVAW